MDTPNKNTAQMIQSAPPSTTQDTGPATALPKHVRDSLRTYPDLKKEKLFICGPTPLDPDEAPWLKQLIEAEARADVRSRSATLPTPDYPPRQAPKVSRLHLYHGTTSTHLLCLLTHGIAPHRVARPRTNWKTVPSPYEVVDLTSTYPLYFAAHTLTSSDKSTLVVVEVAIDDLEEGLFYPDENFLPFAPVTTGQRARAHGTPDIKNLFDQARHLWRNSLDTLGTCAFRGTIPPHAIVRYATIDQHHRLGPVFEAMNADITPDNYQTRGAYHRQCLAWIFDEQAPHPQLQQAREQLASCSQVVAQLWPKAHTQLRERLALWEAESQNRTGVTVTTL